MKRRFRERQALIDIFNDSAAMPGNETAFLRALRAYEEVLVPWDSLESLLAARIDDPTEARTAPPSQVSSRRMSEAEWARGGMVKSSSPQVGNGRQDCDWCEGDPELCDGMECQK